jgi:7-keto-8-aminopelargonate synthetase-like enzyme
VGPNGRGSAAEAGLPTEAFLQTGTFSKALGGFGGLVAGPAGLAARVVEKSKAFVGATPVPPPFAAAGIRALEILRDSPGLITGLRERMLRVRERVRALGFRVPASPAPIVSITHHDVEKNFRLRSLLLDRGIYPPLIHYPGSPPGGHFRFTISSAHAEEDIERLLDALGASCK